MLMTNLGHSTLLDIRYYMENGKIIWEMLEIRDSALDSFYVLRFNTYSFVSVTVITVCLIVWIL